MNNSDNAMRYCDYCGDYRPTEGRWEAEGLPDWVVPAWRPTSGEYSVCPDCDEDIQQASMPPQGY